MAITAEQVKALRDKTGAGMMECKHALQETGGDEEKAIDVLRKKGLASASKRAGRATSNGVVGSYIHMGGKVGVLVEVNCETDFVARTDDFQQLVKELALHIAAADPRYIRREDVPADVLDREKDIYRGQFADSGKPANVVEKIVEGKLGAYYSQVVLLDQPSVRDPDVTVSVSPTVNVVAEKPSPVKTKDMLPVPTATFAVVVTEATTSKSSRLVLPDCAKPSVQAELKLELAIDVPVEVIGAE